MDNKVIGVIVGVVGMVFWFFPFVSYEETFFGMAVYIENSGDDIGGIAYLILASFLAYAFFSWYEKHPLRIVAMAITVLYALLFIVTHLEDSGIGIVGIFIASIVGLYLAWTDIKKSKLTSSN